MNTNDIIEDFYGVYLLYNVGSKYKGRIYIGFTVDPNRRINQHNKGARSGGARKTSCKGPWEMVLIIHGFPNHISALRFEWAWQNPKKSRRLRHLPVKKTKESSFDFAVRILLGMLSVGPWCQLPLTIRWLHESYVQNFPITSQPPLHMSIAHGRVAIKKLSKSASVEGSSQLISFCYKCQSKILPDDLISCVNPHCELTCHVICFSTYFTKIDSNRFIPVEGKCPSCEMHVLWGDLVRKKKGCYKNLQELAFNSDELTFDDADVIL